MSGSRKRRNAGSWKGNLARMHSCFYSMKMCGKAVNNGNWLRVTTEREQVTLFGRLQIFPAAVKRAQVLSISTQPDGQIGPRHRPRHQVSLPQRTPIFLQQPPVF